MISAGTVPKVRRARRTDSVALADISAASWRQAYGGIIPHAHLECMINRRRKDWWQKAVRNEPHLLVVEIGGKVAGYASCGAARHDGVYKGEIYEIYVDPLYQGLGLGEHLFEACRNALDQRSLDGLIVWALEDNDMAAAFYWRRGGRPVARTTEPFGQVKLGKIAYAWR